MSYLNLMGNKLKPKEVNDALEEGGSALPEVTSDDNGDALTVVNGAWNKAEIAFANALILDIDGSTRDKLFVRNTADEITAAFANGRAIIANGILDSTGTHSIWIAVSWNWSNMIELISSPLGSGYWAMPGNFNPITYTDLVINTTTGDYKAKTISIPIPNDSDVDKVLTVNASKLYQLKALSLPTVPTLLHGTISIPEMGESYSYYNGTVTFGVTLPSANYDILLSFAQYGESGQPGSQNMNYLISGKSTTGFTVSVSSDGTSPAGTLTWTIIQEPTTTQSKRTKKTN